MRYDRQGLNTFKDDSDRKWVECKLRTINEKNEWYICMNRLGFQQTNKVDFVFFSRFLYNKFGTKMMFLVYVRFLVRN